MFLLFFSSIHSAVYYTQVCTRWRKIKQFVLLSFNIPADTNIYNNIIKLPITHNDTQVRTQEKKKKRRTLVDDFIILHEKTIFQNTFPLSTVSHLDLLQTMIPKTTRYLPIYIYIHEALLFKIES